jgi:hypothetical protein
MKRIFLFGAALILAGAALHAQPGIGTLQDGHNSANAARHLPTYLGDQFKKVQITVFNPYFSLGSSFASFEDARGFMTADQITRGMISNTIDKLDPEDNNINGVVDIALLNVALNIGGGNGRKGASLGFGVNERVEMNMLFNEDLLLLAWKGNKQFAGKTVNLMPRFNGLAFTEYYVAASYEIAPSFTDAIIKPAIRLSYLSGQASVQMPKDNAISLFTEPEGRYLDFDFNYTVNASMDADSLTLEGNTFNINEKSFRGGAGSGFGMDLGLRVTPRPGLSFNLGIMDIGSIRFKKGVTNMFNHSSYRYEGQELTFAEDQSINLDSLAGLAKPSYTHEAYTVKLPTKLVLSANIGLGRVEKKGSVYYRHQLTAMYLQGFDNYLSSTKKPYLALGYTHSLGNVLNLGANAGIGGITGATFGVLASVKAGPFCFGLHSNNIIPLIAPSSGRGADLGMLLGLAF